MFNNNINMDELVDIVNEQDEIITQNMKSEAHSNILLHRTVHWVIINSKKEIFFVKRALNREKWPWLYDASIGWHVLAWESYDNAIIREWSEEQGIEWWEYNHIATYLAEHPKMKHMCAIYIITYDGVLTPDPREFDSGEWMSYEEIMKIPAEKFTPDWRITLEKINSYFN